MKNYCFILVVLSSTACAAAISPAPPSPRSAVPVSAPFAKTWDAVIDVFAAKNIPIKNMDRSSGFIATEEMNSGLKLVDNKPQPYADCGTNAMKMYEGPTNANYNIRVKGDERSSNVLVTVFWKQVTGSKYGKDVTCVSRGTWEAATETEIKSKAESK
jgi:hypothetical protein